MHYAIYHEFVRSLIEGYVKTEEFEEFVQQQWRQGILAVPLLEDDI